ncbi:MULTISPECIES: GntR family transcriptional regulator [Winslowiella]|uniref:GntR family transcriptional regulator n=1 Tax=Winslowiella TaxID=2997349 RepID=UPI0028BD5F75|nr:GntR family transcriptional regulator [Winslowiella toletana]WNN42736.1 GntR family transcriptional regulator [Winslowiella toletana]
MSQTRYSTVAEDLTEAIASGTYPVGSLLPTEFELCELYNVSRHTVRAAILKLQEQGLVSRRKRVGTRVEASKPYTGYSQALGSLSDLAHLAETQTRSIQQIRHFVADTSEACRLEIQPGGHYFCVSSIRVDQQHGRTPICWTDVYADERYAEVIPAAQAKSQELIASLIEQQFARHIAAIEQRVQAVLLSETLAQQLNARAGTPALKITRFYRDESGENIVVSETIHPEDRFTLIMHVERDKHRS